MKNPPLLAAICSLAACFPTDLTRTLRRLLVVAACILIGLPATASVTVTTTSGNIIPFVSSSGDNYDIVLRLPDALAALENDVLIQASTDAYIKSITIKSCENQFAAVNLSITPVGTGRILEVPHITYAPSDPLSCVNGIITVGFDVLVINGDLTNTLWARGFSSVSVAGDILASIVVEDSLLPGGAKEVNFVGIGDIVVGGDVQRSIDAGDTNFGQLIVNGVISQGSILPTEIVGRTIGRVQASDIEEGVEIVAAEAIGRIDVQSGTFAGALNAGWLNDIDPASQAPGIYLRHLEGSIAIDYALDEPLVIDRTFGPNATITLPASGLQTIIKINNGSGDGDWDGTVVVGSNSLAVSTYTQTASSLGGGTVGLVPFDLHGSSCVPANGATLFGTGLDIGDPELGCIDIIYSLNLRMYGPVDLIGSAPHFTVKSWDGSAWQTAAFSLNAVIASGSNDLNVQFSRSGGLAIPLGKYLIEPIAGQVKCKGVGVSPTLGVIPDVVEWDYIVEFVDGCGELGLLEIFDVNTDDQVCSQDVAAWMNSPCDFNGDNVADSEDLSQLLVAADRFANLD